MNLANLHRYSMLGEMTPHSFKHKLDGHLENIKAVSHTHLNY